MTYNNLGNAYGVKGAFAQAADAYRQAVGLDPQYAEAWMNLGVTAMRAGEPAMAAEGFRQAAVLLPNDEETHFNLGVALQNTGTARRSGAGVSQVRVAGRREGVFQSGPGAGETGQVGGCGRRLSGVPETVAR